MIEIFIPRNLWSIYRETCLKRSNSLEIYSIASFIYLFSNLNKTRDKVKIPTSNLIYQCRHIWFMEYTEAFALTCGRYKLPASPKWRFITTRGSWHTIIYNFDKNTHSDYVFVSLLANFSENISLNCKCMRTSWNKVNISAL